MNCRVVLSLGILSTIAASVVSFILAEKWTDNFYNENFVLIRRRYPYSWSGDKTYDPGTDTMS